MRVDGGGSVEFAPRTPASVVYRSRLVDILEQSEAPLVIVRAPGGTGKSTLIADWIHNYPRAGVWVSIDPSSGQRFAFWRRVIEAVCDSGLAPKDSVLFSTIPNPEMANSLRSVLLRGFNTLPEPITVILDDFQEIADPEVHEDLHWLLRSGARMRAVIRTRTSSALESPENASRLDTTVLLVSDLALTLAEVSACALMLGADPASAHQLHAAFAGWGLPTRTALLELASGRAARVDEAVRLVQASSSQLPLNLDPNSEYTQFLLRSSVARRVTPAFATAVGGPAADSHLARLEKDGFGGWTSHAGHLEFSIHPVVREQLEQELVHRMPDEVPALRRAYAKDRVNHGDPLAAAQQFAALGDLRSLVDVVRLFFGDIVLNHMNSLVEIIRAADQTAVRRHPELIAMLLLQTSRSPGSARVGILHLASLGIASAQARYGRGDPVEQISLLSALLASQRLSGNYAAAVPTAQKIAALISSLDDAGRDALRGILPQALIHSATTHFYAERLGEAAPEFHDARSLAEHINRPWGVLHADSMLALVDATRGDVNSARSRIQSAEARTTPQGWRGTYTAAGHHLAIAYDALERFDGDAARAELSELAPHEATIEHWPVIAHLRAVASLVDGASALGLVGLERDIAQHASRPPTSDAMMSLLAITRIDLLLADRQPDRAANALRRLRGDWGAELARARMDLLAGRHASAVRRATSIAWSADHSARDRAAAMLTVGAAARRLHQDDAAREATLRAVDLLSAAGLRRPLLAIPRADLALLLAEAGADQLLTGVPDVLPAPLSDWHLTPAELRVLTALPSTDSVDGLAAQLHLSSNTVKTHLRQVYRKLGATSREEALGIASLHGIAGASFAPEDATGTFGVS